MKQLITTGAIATMCVIFLGSTTATAATIAQEPAQTVIALAPSPRGLEVLANRIAAISVSGHAGGVLAAQAKGHVTRAIKATTGRTALLTQLDAGTRYQVTMNGKRIGFANVVGQVGAANELTVQTTDVASEVSLTWRHTVNKGEGSPVMYTISATAENFPPLKTVTSESHAVLKGLHLNLKYTFTVTPSNSASTGRISTAVMKQTLQEISGVSNEIAMAPALTSAGTPAKPAIQPVAQPASPPQSEPTLNPAPAPVAVVPQPTYKTIYVCPESFTDAGVMCQKTSAFTFHSVTTTSPYTYHLQFIQTGSHTDFSSSPNGGTYYTQDQWNPSDGSPAGYYAVNPDGYNTSVKDSPPAGFTDGGGNYTKTVNVKDSAPIGYADNGALWIMTAAKLAKVVPV